MTRLQHEEPPTGFREKWQFFRRTPIIFTGWLVFALAAALIGWGTLLAHLEEEQITAENLALLEASALAKSYAGQLMRSIDGFDQIGRYVRSDWQRSAETLRLDKISREGVFPHYS